MSKNGFRIVTPTSIASTGTGNSSSINTNGSVTFSSCATLSLNGVFSADYDNYMIVMRDKVVTGDGVDRVTYFQLRASGVDTGFSNYTDQLLTVNSTTVTGNRSSGVGYFGGVSETTNGGTIAYFYGPYLNQPTAKRSLSVSGYQNAQIVDTATTHSLSSSYDGITLGIGSGYRFGGLLAVYGMRK